MANPNEKPTGKYSATESYLNSTHRIGRISGVIAIILIMMVPAVITFVNRDIPVDLSKTFSAIVTLTAIYGVVSVVEVVSFSPYLGTGGTYLSFITGNIMNMKLPAAMNALRVNKLDRDSDEAEVVTTLAISASSIVTTLVLFFGMLFLGNLLVPIITGPALAPAFDNVTPALTGALRHRSKIGFQISNPAHAMPCAILTDPLRQIVTPCWHSCHFIQPYVFFICTCVTRVVSCNIVRASRPMPGLCLCRNTTRGFFVFLLFQKGVLTTWPHKTQFCMQKSASKQDCPFQQVPYVQLF